MKEILADERRRLIEEPKTTSEQLVAFVETDITALEAELAEGESGNLDQLNAFAQRQRDWIEAHTK